MEVVSQLMGPGLPCWSVIPLIIPSPLPLISAPPCSQDGVLEPRCDTTLPGLYTFMMLPPTSPSPGSAGPMLPLGLAQPPSLPYELSPEAPVPSLVTLLCPRHCPKCEETAVKEN